MRPHRTAILAAFLLATGLAALLFAATRTEEDPGRLSHLEDVTGEKRAGAPPATAESGAAARDSVSEANASARIRDLDTPGGPDPAASDPDAEGAASADDLDASALQPLPAGAGRIQFAVEDASGRPVSDATVSLRSLEECGGIERATTGSWGEARFVGLAAGRYGYRVRAPGREEVESEHPVRLEEGEYEDVTVRMVGAELRIVGRLLDERGEPVAGVEISAVRHRFASTVSEESAATAPHTAISRSDGSFAITVFAEGEYDVRTQATERHPPLETLLQAGGAQVDLILREGLRVAGTVRSASGDPLLRVRVGPHDRRARPSYTDDAGSYELFLERDPDREAPRLVFFVSGYEEMQLPLPAPGPDGIVRVDAELQALPEGALVSGVVETERGDPVSGASVVLSARPGTPYQTVSHPDGSFSLPHVEIGPGYHLRVLPDGHYLDYSRTGIRVPENGLSLEVALEPLPTARLRGRMVDVEGNPVSGLRLWVVNGYATRSAIPVAGDDRGNFDLDAAPAGTVIFDTRSSPLLRVVGATLPAGGQADVELVLDWGEEAMTGLVLDDRGDPVAGAQVSLSWSHSGGGMQSTSQRSTRTDPGGAFRFTRLGPGEHRLDVRAGGFRAFQERYELGRYAAEVEVRLEPAGR